MVGNSGTGCFGNFTLSWDDGVVEPTTSTSVFAVGLSLCLENIELELVGFWYSISSIPNDGFNFDVVIAVVSPKTLVYESAEIAPFLIH